MIIDLITKYNSLELAHFIAFCALSEAKGMGIIMKKAELLKNLGRRRRMFEDYLKEKKIRDHADPFKTSGLRNAGGIARRGESGRKFKDFNTC